MNEKRNKLAANDPDYNIYRGPKFNVMFYPSLYDTESCKQIYNNIEQNAIWRTPITKGRRSNQTYGDEGLTYEINFKGNISKRTALSWDKLPILKSIKRVVEIALGATFNICVVQRYPSGKVGINPHRDKEMKPGTLIAGLSFGETRKLILSPPKYINEKSTELNLYSGSLYVLAPPTNDYWTHCIEKDDSQGPRLSLTFRTY